MKLKCKLGLHSWQYNQEIYERGGFLSCHSLIRKCERCNKKQREVNTHNHSAWFDGWPSSLVIVNTADSRQCTYCIHGNHIVSNYPDKVLCMVNGSTSGVHVLKTHSCDRFTSEADALKTVNDMLDEIESDEVIGE